MRPCGTASRIAPCNVLGALASGPYDLRLAALPVAAALLSSLGLGCLGHTPAPASAGSAPDDAVAGEPPPRDRDEQPPPGPDAATPASCDGSIDGHVVDAATHEPVIGATVATDGEVVALTDEHGRFMLSDLCRGELLVEVERVGYEVGRRTLSPEVTSSIELALRAVEGEVIVIEDEAPAPVDMRSTTTVSGEALERTRGRSFSATLTEVPGVTQLRSPSGLAKPIVRGQFGRRLLMLVDGVRHRSQDWGLDHAPEIDPFVADEITVVRGTAGVQYGPDAIGGAILADPPGLLRRPGIAGELHILGFSDRGAGGAARVRGAAARLPGLAWQLEGSAKRLAAPSSPDYALDNTGSLEWNAGVVAGYRGEDADYTLSYRHYHAQLGVCRCLRIESSEDFFAQLERARPIDADLYRSDFAIERPYQKVDHDLAIARGHWRVPSLGTVTGTYALQFDHRREYEIVRSSTGPQFDFQLATHDLDLGLAHDPIHLSDHLHLRGRTGVVGMVQEQGYGGLPLVPDYLAWSGGAYALERLVGHTYELEAGVRYDVTHRAASIARTDFLRLVRSGQLAMDACGTKDDDPVGCASTFHTVSASVGGQLQILPPWSVKLDLSTASRPPDPDEQYLNGTSPTFPVLGLGKPDLGAETTYSAAMTTSLETAHVAGELSVYGNFIDDYVYFAPALDEAGDPIFDVLIRGAFPRFVTRPVDAVFYGFDGGLTVEPVPGLALGAQASVVRARNVTDDGHLVFVPPDRVRGTATYTRTHLGPLSNAYVSVTGTYVARQRHFDLAADLAPPPDAYFLLDAEVGAETRVRGQAVRLAVQGTNLLDTRYRDYTSLLRYFADQPGWQLILRLSIHYTTFDHD